jgi:hypothetical protein
MHFSAARLVKGFHHRGHRGITGEIGKTSLRWMHALVLAEEKAFDREGREGSAAKDAKKSNVEIEIGHYQTWRLGLLYGHVGDPNLGVLVVPLRGNTVEGEAEGLGLARR